jgi:hypothetical protein
MTIFHWNKSNYFISSICRLLMPSMSIFSIFSHMQPLHFASCIFLINIGLVRFPVFVIWYQICCRMMRFLVFVIWYQICRRMMRIPVNERKLDFRFILDNYIERHHLFELIIYFLLLILFYLWFILLFIIVQNIISIKIQVNGF